VRDANQRRGCTVVLVTHDARAAAYGERVITLKDGRLVDESPSAATAR
jgi:ABC-type lipoprotein export system ATPase subunit